MERLTERVGENGRTVIYVGEHKQYEDGDIPAEISDAAKREVLKRLAAYEDTGLTPRQITMAMDTLKLCDSIGAMRMNEILDAEQEGRLVVLPCKVGDVLWRIETVCYADDKCPPYADDCDHCTRKKKKVITPIKMLSQANIVNWSKNIGIDLFLTREDAEKALEAQGER